MEREQSNKHDSNVYGCDLSMSISSQHSSLWKFNTSKYLPIYNSLILTFRNGIQITSNLLMIFLPMQMLSMSVIVLGSTVLGAATHLLSCHSIKTGILFHFVMVPLRQFSIRYTEPSVVTTRKIALVTKLISPWRHDIALNLVVVRFPMLCWKNTATFRSSMVWRFLGQRDANVDFRNMWETDT